MRTDTDLVSMTGALTSSPTARRRVALLLETGSGGVYGRVTDWFVVALIALDVTVVM